MRTSPRALRRAWMSLALAGLAAAALQAGPPPAETAAEYFRHLPAYRVRLAEIPAESSFEATFRVAGKDNARTVVLLHGICSTSAVWAEAARDLAADFRVVLIDLPGYGDSFTEAPVSYDYSRMTARLLAMLRAAGALEGAVLVGHSTGGALSWHLERSGECRPAGLVLVDAVTVAFKLPFKPAVGFGLVESYAAAGPLFNLIGNRTIQRLIARGSAGRWARPVPESGDESEPMFTTPARLRVNGLWARQMLDEAVVRGWEPELARIGVPVLLVWGGNDGVLRPEVMDRALAAIPGSRAEVIAGAGHSPHQEKPAEVAALVRSFCRGLDMAAAPAKLGPEARRAAPGEVGGPRVESAGRMLHATVSLTADAGAPAPAAAAFHLKRGYYSTSYPSQSGSAGLFVEARRAENELVVSAGLQLELVWEKWGGFRAQGGWPLGDGRTGAMLRLGYVPSHVPWLCLGAVWHGRRFEPALFVSVELAPRLYR